MCRLLMSFRIVSVIKMKCQHTIILHYVWHKIQGLSVKSGTYNFYLNYSAAKGDFKFVFVTICHLVRLRGERHPHTQVCTQ